MWGRLCFSYPSHPHSIAILYPHLSLDSLFESHDFNDLMPRPTSDAGITTKTSAGAGSASVSRSWPATWQLDAAVYTDPDLGTGSKKEYQPTNTSVLASSDLKAKKSIFRCKMLQIFCWTQPKTLDVSNTDG